MNFASYNSIKAAIRLLGVFVLGILSCVPITNRVFAADSSLAGWGNRVQLVIDHTKVSSDLTNFPVLVHLSQSSGITKADLSSVFGVIGSNREKIAITTSDGVTQLYVEIEKWDSANKQAYLWVKVPSVSSTADTYLYLYYDNTHADNIAYVGDTGSTPAENVWDSNFVGVWHLAESGSGISGEYKDSTSRHHDGTGGAGSSSATPVRVNSQTGYAQKFDGTNDYISIPDSDDFSITTSGDLTIEAQVTLHNLNFPVVESGGYIRWMGKGNSSAQQEWQFVAYRKDAPNDNRSQRISFYNYSPSGGAGAGDYSTGAFAQDQAVYITATAHATDATHGIEYIYRDDAIHTGNASPWQQYGLRYSNGTAPVRIGTQYLAKYDFWNGTIAEVRISKVTRSAAWIKASFYSETDNLLSYSFLTNQPLAVTTNAATGITATGATLNANLTSQGTASNVTVSFEYGLTASYGSTAIGVPPKLNGPGTFTTSLTGLTPNTLYHYRAKAIGDGTTFGADQTFTTFASYVTWDINMDGKVDILDVTLVAQHNGETGVAGWIHEDLNFDGKIDVLDIILAGQHFN